MSKKATIFYGGFLARSGGAFMHARTISPELERQGWCVDIVTLDNLPFLLRYVPHLVEKLINLFRFPLGFYYKGRFTRKLFKIFSNQPSDLLIFEDIYISWNSGVPSVSLLHAVWSDNLQAFRLTEQEKIRLLSREAEAINDIAHPLITVSEAYRQFLVDEHFRAFKLRAVDVVPLGIDFPANLGQFSSPRLGNSLVYCGALEARKNVMLLLQLFEKLRASNENYFLTIIGDGPQGQELRDYCHEKDLAVRFLGRMNHPDVLSELLRHSLYVHTSQKESFSFALLEAKLAGLTTIAYFGLQVPDEFIDVPVKSFAVDDWCQAIINRTGDRKPVDAAIYTPASMTQSTLDLAFKSD